MTPRPTHAIVLALIALFFTSGCKTLDTQAMKPPQYTITGPDGAEVSQEALFEEAVQADVVLVGETHDNPAAHHLEYALLKGLIERRTTEGNPPRVALSLEMLARDLQPVTDEYLAGLITELHFIAASRPWGNYNRSYRKMINLSKEKGVPVIAANAPRRYVNLVAREGKEALTRLSPEALAWIAPLPYEEASPIYRAKLKALEERFNDKRSDKQKKTTPHGEMPTQKPSGINPDSQALWDATMAWSIAEAMQKSPETLVMHITGAFHCEGGLGIPEHLALYAPSASVLIITIRPPQTGEPLPPFHSDLPVREYTVQTE